MDAWILIGCVIALISFFKTIWRAYLYSFEANKRHTEQLKRDFILRENREEYTEHCQAVESYLNVNGFTNIDD